MICTTFFLISGTKIPIFLEFDRKIMMTFVRDPNDSKSMHLYIFVLRLSPIKTEKVRERKKKCILMRYENMTVITSIRTSFRDSLFI